MTEKEKAARRIFEDAFKQVKALGVEAQLDFGIAVKHVTNPSAHDFEFIEIEKDEG